MSEQKKRKPPFEEFSDRVDELSSQAAGNPQLEKAAEILQQYRDSYRASADEADAALLANLAEKRRLRNE
jgi:hypothetical protein